MVKIVYVYEIRVKCKKPESPFLKMYNGEITSRFKTGDMLLQVLLSLLSWHKMLNPILPRQAFGFFACWVMGAIMVPLFTYVSVTPVLLKLSRTVPTSIKRPTE